MEEFSWSYAIGTLFIRFFGIFLVLGSLMLGMIVSGKIFARLKRRENRQEESVKNDGPAPSESVDPNGEQIAAAAAALHLHRRRAGGSFTSAVAGGRRSAWAEQGRAALMAGFSGARGWRQGQ